jgi:hypothetical protein
MKAQGTGPISVERVHLRNTIVNDWYYVFKHHFIDAGRPPDALVLCFAAHYLRDISIQRPLVARYHSSLRDVPRIFTDDVPDFDGRVEFLLSAWSASFTHRVDVERRMLDALIPHYREAALRVNRFLEDEALRKRPANYQPTYRGLERLVRMAKDHGVRLILVALPVKSSYAIDPEIMRIVETEGIALIDSRSVDGLGEESYVDEIHMNSDAAAIYSRFLARRLADYFKQNPIGEAFLPLAED